MERPNGQIKKKKNGCLVVSFYGIDLSVFWEFFFKSARKILFEHKTVKEHANKQQH